MKQFEKRFYPRNELSEILNIDLQNKHFADKVKSTFTKWGYTFEYSRKGLTITAIPETAYEKLSEMMIRNYNLDVQVDVYDFAIFTFCLLEDIDGFASMPWECRSNYLNETWNVNVNDRTLRNWCNKLLATNTVIKDKNQKTYWQSYRVGDIKYQEELEGGKANPQWKKYWKRFFELKELGCKDIGGKIYGELGYCVYSCATFAFGAFDDTGVLEEMLTLIAEIANSEAVDTVVKTTVEIIEIPRIVDKEVAATATQNRVLPQILIEERNGSFYF